MSNREQYRVLHEAMEHLASRDTDFASVENREGFSRFDGTAGHRLAETPFDFWTDTDVVTGWRIARRYRSTQLSHLPAIEGMEDEPYFPGGFQARMDTWKPRRGQTPQDDPKTKGAGFASLTVHASGSMVVARWGGNDPKFNDRVAAIKAIPGSRFIKGENEWHVPLSIEAIGMLTDLIAESQAWEVPFLPEAGMDRLFDDLVHGQIAMLEASSAKDADLEVRGLRAGTKLRPFQKAGVAYAMESRRCIIGDAPGLGKTIQAIAAVVATQSFPALIVVPATLKLNWETEINSWVPGANIQLCSGRSKTRVDSGADWVIVNYDILNAWSSTFCAVKWGAVIADESHALKNGKAIRTKAARAIIHQTKPDTVIFLTGTPILNRPLELWAQLECLGHDRLFGGFWRFASRYCAATDTGFGFDFKGASNLDELNTKLRANGVMVRRTKEEVLTELPPKQWATVPVEMSTKDAKRYRQAERSVAEWAAKRKSEDRERYNAWYDEGLGKGFTGDGLNRFVDSKRKAFLQNEQARLGATEQLIRFTELKQLAYECKREGVYQWIDAFLETDKKLVVFGWHREAVQDLARRYNAPMIAGGMKQEEVERGKRAFQNDPEVRVIVCNIMAGGVGHTLTAASDVLFVEYPWNPAAMDQAADRCHRIGQRDSVTAWQMMAVTPDGGRTIDGEIVELIGSKREVVNAATDGSGTDEQSGIFTALLDRINGRALPAGR